MIPKVIHYCWFGRNALPADAQKCIASWRKFMPDYEIKEWNEDNFDINIIPYTAQAYAAKKYAFVSDYARFWIVYNYGGLYFDTDVEIIKPLDDIIGTGAFMGIEKSMATRKNNPSGWIGINPGLGIGATAGNLIYKAILDKYANMNFDLNDGTVVKHTTDVLTEFGYDGTNTCQQVHDINVYSDEYFCPMDSTTGLVHLTPNSYTIHHYSCSWIDRKSLAFQLHILKNKLIKLLGPTPVLVVTALINKIKTIRK